MSDFLQLHVLTPYAPSNLNRDDSGRPKSADMGGVPRLRISSQSLKRAWRTSDVFRDTLGGHLAKRTARIGEVVERHLLEGGVKEKTARNIARVIADVFGTEKGKGEVRNKELAFISPDEERAALAWADRAIAGDVVEAKAPEILQTTDTAVDIAMFGRMLAKKPAFNREAAVQVAHAITTHRGIPEDDYYTAVDDLKSREDGDDSGAGFLDVAEFGAGVFYIYVCIDRTLLIDNLGDNKSLANSGISALVRALTTVAPSGKQASYASRSRAVYGLAERGSAQPRSLAAAFFKPVTDSKDYAAASVAQIEEFRKNMDAVYGPCAASHYAFNALEGEGSLDEMVAFCTN